MVVSTLWSGYNTLCWVTDPIQRPLWLEIPISQNSQSSHMQTFLTVFGICYLKADLLLQITFPTTLCGLSTHLLQALTPCSRWLWLLNPRTCTMDIYVALFILMLLELNCSKGKEKNKDKRKKSKARGRERR